MTISTSFLRASGFRRIALLASGVVSLLLACTATPQVKAEKLCDPGAYVFCRCRDRNEGSKLCAEDGMSFGACEPCETDENPEDTDPDPDPFPEPETGAPDGGIEAGTEEPQECGDGKVEVGEDCDDDNTNETDGCDSKCKLAGITATATNACPGLEVHVWGGTHKPTLVTKTTGAGNRSVTPACSGPNPTSGAAAPDRVFKVVAHKTGTMVVTASEADYNVLLYVSDACKADANTWLVCANDSAAAAGETMQFAVDAGKSYWVFLDGAGIGTAQTPPNKEGTARITFAIQ